jgi:triacylglycerol lipase
MIKQLIAALVEAGADVDAEAIADALWLMRARRDESEDGDRQLASAVQSAPTEPRPPDAEPQHPVDSIRGRRSDPLTMASQAAFGSDAAGSSIVQDKPRALPGALELDRTLRPLTQAGVRSRGRGLGPLGTVGQAVSGSDDSESSIALRRARALPGVLELSRALRPLKQRHPSKRNLAFDAEATVEYFSDTGVLMPVLRPGAERWFDVDVLVEVGPSMVVWQDTAAELVSLLERHGAFREVRRWALEQVDGKVRLSRIPGMRSAAPQLIDPAARRLTMVMTDCIGQMWYQAPIWDAIREWGLFSPVVLITMLPFRLWPRTALGSPELTMRSYRPGMANRLLSVDLPWWWPDDDPPQSTMPVPVITLQADSVAAWARMVMGVGGVEIPGVFAMPPVGQIAARSGGPPDAEERVQRFRVTVSPIAYRLAVYLSAALRGKWELALARVVQEAMLPDSGQVHLAEVLVGGLVRQADPGTAWGEPLYEFVGGVASVLQRSLTSTEALGVLQALGGYVERETGRSPGIAAMLLGETPPAETSDQFGNVRAGAADLIRAMGLARAQGVPAPVTEITSPASAIGLVPAAVTWGTFIQAAAAQYASDPGQVNPAAIKNLPAGYTLVRTIQMTDFFGPAQSRVFCGFVAVGGDPKTAVVALRGAVTATEWWDDFHWDLVPFTQVATGGMVAQGFVDIYNTLGTMTPGQRESTPTANFAVDVARAVADALGTDLDPAQSIVVCGHSLGGALATLLVLDLNANTPLFAQAWTFASPKVGNAVFAARYAGRTVVSWRIYNQADIVPYLPLDVFDNYQPVTTGYAINSQGRAKWTPGCAHSLNTYLHVLSPATAPLDPACS